ncbi:amidohydrolase family protein [Chitinasiproducens palmae]|uniref:Predicted metal-dependent hydrolase, TIM-barrel fold n=1 Tax=Chitinasiproducens palmae TaxID=1770053 RepID=A0A1H2PKM2_9BURK|nr:amidohydrolase family protein [Chitinasiproducens palmae]SDV47013.1 Predicted metal-dependent hydrolase, TIM-barrel fold [Chitinasiproducens palmae]
MIAHDTHAHVFALTLPFVQPRRYTPERAAPPSDYLAQLDAQGVGCGWLVQPSFLGFDNRYIAETIACYPRRFVGVAVIDPALGVAQLDPLDQAGFVGIRLNLDGQPLPDFDAPVWRALLPELRARGWHIEVHRDADDLAALLAPLVDANVKVVVDHFGRPDAVQGVDDPGFRRLLAFGASRGVWVKLSAAYRNGGVPVARGAQTTHAPFDVYGVDGAARGEAIARQATPLLLEHFGAERLVWGSDWPHTRYEAQADFAATYAALEGWVADPTARRTIRCVAPAALLSDTHAGATLADASSQLLN